MLRRGGCLELLLCKVICCKWPYDTNRQCLNDTTTPLLRCRVRQVVQILRAPVPGELAAEERSDEPRVASVRSDGAAAARDAGRVPDAPRVEPAHRDAGDVAQRVAIISGPFALRHPVPRGFVRIDHEGQVDVRVLSGHELVKRVRDDIFSGWSQVGGLCTRAHELV